MKAAASAKSLLVHAADALASRPVLLVDQDPDARIILRRLLEHHGYDALEAVDADGALDLARERDVSLIVSELFVRREGGTACLVESVRADRELSSIPVLIVTTRAFGEDEQRARRAGSAGYIVKPFSAMDVMEQIARLVSAPAR